MNSSVPFHATILIGQPELCKTKALELSQALVCSAPEGQRPCGMCRDCRKAAESTHPDIIPIENFMEEKDLGGEIKINPIRALRQDAFIRPNEARSKVYIIQNANKMNINAQNALLKILEEGPPYAVFLLLCDRVGALLETIRSRCAVIHVGGEEYSDETDELASAFAEILVNGSEFERAAFAAEVEMDKPDKAKMEKCLKNLEEIINDAVIGSVTGQFHVSETAKKLAFSKSKTQLLDWIRIVQKGQDMLSFHVSTGQLMGWLITSLT